MACFSRQMAVWDSYDVFVSPDGSSYDVFLPPDGSMEHGHLELEIDAETLERMASRASGDLPQGAALLNGGLLGQ